MKRKYLIIGNAENTHMLKWVKALSGYYDLFLISSKTTHASIHNLLPSDHIYNLDIAITAEGGNYKLLREYGRVRKIINEIKPDIINPHYITSHGFLAALVKKFNRTRFVLVQSAWGSDILVTPFQNKIYRQITRFCLKMADIATSDSMHMTEVLGSIYPVTTLTFSFGLDELPPYHPSEKNNHLYYSNRMLSANYNIDEVIRFFSRIAAHDHEARLIIAHDGTERQSLKSLVQDLRLEDRVTFMGFIDEKEQELNYRKARFYISIPTSDATSVSLLEAMAYGCVPIVSDIPANREWITEGENGIYYKSGKTGFDEISMALVKQELFVGRNREIIKKRAIFPDAIKNYVEQLKNMFM